MAKQRPVTKPGVVMEVPVQDIDTSPTQLVRARLDAETVERYAEAADELPPVDVFMGGGRMFAGDGGHRIAGRIRAGHKKINANVRDCGTEEAAFAEARRFALGANTQHGLPRSKDDKRQAVRSALIVPEYGVLSDREVADLCKVSHQLVGDIRHEMTWDKLLTGPAASKKEGPPRDRSAKAIPEPKPAASGRATTSQPDPNPEPKPAPVSPPIPRDADEEPEAAREVVARPQQQPKSEKPFTDGRGRVVPDALVPQFRLAKAFLNDFRGVLREAAAGLKSVTDEPWGGGIKQLLPNLEGDLDKLSTDAGAAIPFVCCPHVAQATGEHEVPGNCRTCVKNRGWLTRHNWHTLSDPVKKLIDEFAEPDAEKDAA